MNFRRDDYVKIVGSNGDFRYGYIGKTTEGGWHLEICMHDEGDSKIGYDTEWNEIHGEDPLDLVHGLTEIEKRLIGLIAQGCSTNEIGRQMSISPVTVRSHIRNLRIKLQLENREQLAVYAQGIQNRLKNNDR